MKASDYPVTHPFGATYSPWTKATPHTGDDHGDARTKLMPPGTPVNVGSTIIGLSGATGKATGPHLHVQKYKGGYLNPQGNGLASTVPLPATVTETGTAADKGNYVRLVDADGVRWSYFHLSKINVSKGQVINKGGDMITQKAYKTAAQAVGTVLGKDFSYPENWTSEQFADFLLEQSPKITREMESHYADQITGIKGVIGWAGYNSPNVGKPVVSQLPKLIDQWIEYAKGLPQDDASEKLKKIKQIIGE